LEIKSEIDEINSLFKLPTNMSPEEELNLKEA
jgi:hypothetical protein